MIGILRAFILRDLRNEASYRLAFLLAFVVPALLLGLVLRRPLISFNRGLVDAMASTKLM